MALDHQRPRKNTHRPSPHSLETYMQKDGSEGARNKWPMNKTSKKFFPPLALSIESRHGQVAEPFLYHQKSIMYRRSLTLQHASLCIVWVPGFGKGKGVGPFPLRFLPLPTKRCACHLTNNLQFQVPPVSRNVMSTSLEQPFSSQNQRGSLREPQRSAWHYQPGRSRRSGRRGWPVSS